MHGTSELFAEFIAASPAGFEPRPVEYPTHDVCSYADLVRVVKARLPTDAPFILLAESFSGPIAIQIAAEHPSGLIAVVLAASFVKAPRSSWFRFLPWRALFSARPPRRVLSWLFAGDHCSSELLNRIANLRERVAPRVLSSRVKELLSVNAERELEACTVPILYLRPLKDRLVTQDTVERIRAVCPTVTVAEIESSHYVLQTNPRKCWEHIEKHAEAVA
jgi:pimeloyl-ACP methyl ester carboxylesterase